MKIVHLVMQMIGREFSRRYRCGSMVMAVNDVASIFCEQSDVAYSVYDESILWVYKGITVSSWFHCFDGEKPNQVPNGLRAW